MFKKNANQKLRRLKSLKLTLKQSINLCESRINVFSKEFLDQMRCYTFKSLDDKNDALKIFNLIVHEIKDLDNAVNLKIEGPSWYESIPLEQSIARGKQHPFAKEYIHGFGEHPDWYVQSKVLEN
jgi:hypothetical protein